MKFLSITLSMLCFILGFAQNNTDNLFRIPYNNPELQSVDLGVGLWAWPFPIDYDNNGDLDLLVNCPDKPFNGLWLFQNTSGRKNPVLKSPVRLAESQRNLQIFPWKGKYVATTPGVAYPDFLASFYQNPDTLFNEDFYKSILKKPRLNLWRYLDFVTLLRNKGTKIGLTILEASGPLSKAVLAGHSTSPTVVDWDKNDIPDLLIGAEDGHFYYLKNSSK